MNRSLKILFLATLSMVSTAAEGQSTPTGVTRIDLQRHDLSIEGRETVQARIEIAPGMPELHTERIPLQQVFLNLILNAIDAMA